jgi:hypothetical protein
LCTVGELSRSFADWHCNFCQLNLGANSFYQALDYNRGTDGSTSLEVGARFREGDLPQKDPNVLPNRRVLGLMLELQLSFQIPLVKP